MKYSFLIYSVLLSLFGVHSSAFAQLSFKSNAVAVDQLGNDFVFDKKSFKGNWKTRKGWEGVLCNGEYQYRINVNGATKRLDFEILDDNSILGEAELEAVYAGVKGHYLSELTACLPMEGWLGISADSVKIRVKVTLGVERPEDIKIRVLETKFGTIHMGDMFPSWFEEFATELLNEALVEVWPSQLGEWLSEQIKKVVKDKLPTQ